MPKPHHCQVIATLAAVLVTPLALHAQATTFTAPSGYTTISAAAAADASTPTYSFVSHSLAPKRQAAAALTGGGTDTLTVSGAGWTANEFATTPHYVLIASGDSAGNIYDIVGNSPDTLTLKTGSGDFSSPDFVGVSITIYEHNTLASVFGADPTTKGLVGGLNASEADQVILYDDTLGFTTYIYKDEDNPRGDPGVRGWIVSGDSTVDVGSTKLPPNQGFIILRRATTPLSITVFGDVIDDMVNVPIISGYNFICVPHPVPDTVTLNTSNLYNAADPEFLVSLEPGLTANDAELVVLWNGSGYSQYYYKNVDNPRGDPGVRGWVISGDTSTDVGDTVLNGGFFIFRKAGNPPLDWVFDSVVSP